jgi:hypothetical protein
VQLNQPCYLGFSAPLPLEPYCLRYCFTLLGKVRQTDKILRDDFPSGAEDYKASQVWIPNFRTLRNGGGVIAALPPTCTPTGLQPNRQWRIPALLVTES